jgi:hypothetical protein
MIAGEWRLPANQLYGHILVMKGWNSGTKWVFVKCQNTEYRGSHTVTLCCVCEFKVLKDPLGQALRE